MNEIARLVQAQPPRCLDLVTRAVDDQHPSEDPDSVAFKISYQGHATCHVLGYDLADYNPEYQGPTEFVSPLTLQWPNGDATCIFDSERHGYHGELDSSAKIRGEGPPQRFKCSKCGADKFSIKVVFDYYEDLEDDFSKEEIPNYFHNIAVIARCQSCDHLNEALNMDL